MARDTENNHYLSIGLEKKSWVLKQLKADAHLHQMSDQLGKLAGLRLVEYYRLVAKGVIVAGVTVLAPAGLPQTPVREQPQDVRTNGSASEEVLTESEDLASNIEAGMAYFLSEEL
jgi:hypothetical protein